MTGAILSDDLAGACDAGARAAAAGWRVTVQLAGKEAAADIVSVSTNSRNLSRRAAAAAARAAAQALLDRRPGLLYKKIDSTLRGPWQEEVLAVAEIVKPARVVICPAFPACGRVVRNGRVLVNGEERVERQSLSFPGATILDAESEEDLARIAGLFPGDSVLWVGSGGLARYVFGRNPRPALPLPGARRWAVVAASSHPRTRSQIEWLTPRLGPNVRLMDAQSAARETAPDLGFFVTGGDTAAYLLKLLEAEAVEISGEVEPGVVAGRVRGGPAANATVITKAGGFGEPETIARVLEKLTL